MKSNLTYLSVWLRYQKGASIAKIKNQLKLDVSRETIRIVFKTSLNLNDEKFSWKPPINALNKDRILMFARNHQTWNVEWQNVVWSDKKSGI